MTYTVRVTHSIGDLANDLMEVPVKAAVECQDIIRDGVKAGNMLAKENAKRSAGRAGKHYHKAFTTSVNRPKHFSTGSIFSGEYGPDSALPQGGMKFEWGEGRQTAPHLDLNRSADIIGPALAQEVRQMLDRIFW